MTTGTRVSLICLTFILIVCQFFGINEWGDWNWWLIVLEVIGLGFLLRVVKLAVDEYVTGLIVGAIEESRNRDENL